MMSNVIVHFGGRKPDDRCDLFGKAINRTTITRIICTRIVWKTIETSTPSNNVSTNVTSITNSNATCAVSCSTGGTATLSNVITPQAQFAPPTQLQGIQFVIKVINPNSKCDFKTYTIRLKQVKSMTLKLKEEILEQLGKSIIFGI